MNRSGGAESPLEHIIAARRLAYPPPARPVLAAPNGSSGIIGANAAATKPMMAAETNPVEYKPVHSKIHPVGRGRRRARPASWTKKRP
jgi:hypothetical protein